MEVIVGLGVVVVALGLAAMVVGLVVNSDGLSFAGLIVAMGALIVGLLGIGVLLVTGHGKSPLVEGTCYRAVRHSNTTLVPVGKVLIPSRTSGIDLEVIRCP